jgi:hypothetical protein
LKVTPPFDGFYFIDLDADKTEYLRTLCGDRRDVQIHTGDANKYLTEDLLPTIQYKNFNRALCLLDPYGLDLDWDVIRQAGQSKAIDMLLNFPVIDINRNAIWRNPEKVPQSGVDRMTKLWGDQSWREAAYAESRQTNLFEPEMVKQRKETWRSSQRFASDSRRSPASALFRNHCQCGIAGIRLSITCFLLRPRPLRKKSLPTSSISIGSVRDWHTTAGLVESPISFGVPFRPPKPSCVACRDCLKVRWQ